MAKILVADDNSNIQKMVGLALKDQGIDVVAVGNGEAAVRKISDLRPDLVLADVFMPVRNGYEVCRYVKEDSSLSHIPVILLVGAFDPLDEQEAQRAGADGVLKKPFVPPDPLISMVKSALTRAGVPLRSEKAEEKPEAKPIRSAAELMKGGAGSKLSALTPEKLAEDAPEPPEEFTTAPPHLKIAEGEDPIAFANLLKPQEEQEEFAAKSPVTLGEERNWAETEGQDEEEDEEDSRRSRWRPAELDEEGLEPVARGSSKTAPDWREAAFHGSSPAKMPSFGGWSAREEPVEAAEAAETPAVAVGTLEEKPAETPLPFPGDEWARTVAKGIEEKIAEVNSEPVVAEPDLAENVSPDTAATPPGPWSKEPTPVVATLEEEKVAEASAGESYWDSEAKKASLLASTWDIPAVEPSPDETQEVLLPAEVPPAQEEPEATSAPAGDRNEDEPVLATSESSEESEPKCWEDAWEAPTAQPAESTLLEEAPEPAQPAHEEPEPVREPEPVFPVSAYIGESLVAEEGPPATTGTAAPDEAGQPDMDELVARVLGKMNPEVLQKVTREILKPVIEAIIREELDSKKP